MAKSTKTAKKSQVSAEQVVEAFKAFQTALSNYDGGPVEVEDEEEDEEVEEDEDEDEEEEVELEAPDRDTVESLSIKDLRALAKEYGIEDTKKADILAAFEDLYDEDEDEDDEDEEEEDEEAGYDRDDLEELDLPALRKIAKEEGATAKDVKGLDQDALIDLILGEEEEEDEDEDEDEDEEEVEEVDEDTLNSMSHKELLALAKEIDVKVPKAVQKNSKANQKKLVALILDSGDEE